MEHGKQPWAWRQILGGIPRLGPLGLVILVSGCHVLAAPQARADGFESSTPLGLGGFSGTGVSGAGLSPLGQGPFSNKVLELRKVCDKSLELDQSGSSEGPGQASPSMLCLDAVDAFHLWIDNLGGPGGELQPTISDKESATKDLLELLTFVQSQNEILRASRLQKPKQPVRRSLAEGVMVEHSLRRALARLSDYETWEAYALIGSGLRRSGSERKMTARLRAGLRVDLGSRVDGHAEIQSGTPRKEGMGQVDLPPESSDLVVLSQLWVRTRRIPRLHLWMGLKPDEDDPLAPERWPFFSLGGSSLLLPQDNWNLHIGVRHDRYGLWDPSSDLYRASAVERNLSFIGAKFWPFAGISRPLELHARASIHWYSDPEGILTRLSLGRPAAVTPDEVRKEPYRVVRLDGGARFHRAGTPWALEPYAAMFWNVESKDDRVGSHMALTGQWIVEPWQVEAGLHRSDIGCKSMPPVALSQNLFPGQRAQGLRIAVNRSLNDRLILGASALGQHLSSLAGSRDCPWRSEASQSPHRTPWHFGLTLMHTFGPKAQWPAADRQ
jgi:hypothetical protein